MDSTITYTVTSVEFSDNLQSQVLLNSMITYAVTYSVKFSYDLHSKFQLNLTIAYTFTVSVEFKYNLHSYSFS